MIIALGTFGIILNSVLSYISAKINLKTEREIQLSIYRTILHSDYQSLKAFHTGDLISRITSDASIVSSCVLGWVPNMVSGMVQFLGALLIIIYYDCTMAVIALVTAPVMLIISKAMLKKMKHYNIKMRRLSDKLMSFNEESLKNILIIKAFGLSSLFTKKLKTIQQEYIKNNMDYTKFSVVTSFVISFAGLAVSYLCFGWGVYRLWCGFITFETMTLFLQMAASLSSSFNSLVGMIPSAVSAVTAMGRIMQLTELSCEPQQNSNIAMEILESKSSVSVKLCNT